MFTLANEDLELTRAIDTALVCAILDEENRHKEDEKQSKDSGTSRRTCVIIKSN